MNLSKVDLNLFVVFDAIYTEGNLTKAGQIVGITQPAVSNALARLRETFDDQLFVRTSQGMAPTLVARNIIEPVRHALQLLRNSVQSHTSFNPESAQKTFRLSVGDLGEAILLPLLFEHIGKSAPSISVESFPVTRSELCNELASGRLDFAIDAPAHYGAQVHSKTLIEDSYVLMVNPSHPILQQEMTLDAYLSLPHILISSRKQGPDNIDQALNRLGKRRQIALRAQHYMMTPPILQRSNMAITVPSYFAKSHPELVSIDLPFEAPKLELHLYWHETSGQDPANRWMRELISELLSSGNFSPCLDELTSKTVNPAAISRENTLNGATSEASINAN